MLLASEGKLYNCTYYIVQHWKYIELLIFPTCIPLYICPYPNFTERVPKKSIRPKWHNQIFHLYLWLLLRCCSVWLSETDQHMPLTYVNRSHVFCSIDFFCVRQQRPYLKQIMQHCQVIHILSNRIKVNITTSLLQICRTTLKIRGICTCRTCIHFSRP
jgi:hypothetical protein